MTQQNIVTGLVWNQWNLFEEGSKSKALVGTNPYDWMVLMCFQISQGAKQWWSMIRSQRKVISQIRTTIPVEAALMMSADWGLIPMLDSGSGRPGEHPLVRRWNSPCSLSTDLMTSTSPISAMGSSQKFTRYFWQPVMVYTSVINGC